MNRLFLLCCFMCLTLNVFGQTTYQELSEKALEYVEKDSLRLGMEYFKKAMRLEPTNPHNALLFSNIGSIQRRLEEYDAAVESYTYALNMAPHTISILLNRAAVYMELGEQNRAYIDYCEVFDLDKTNTDALLMRAYIYVSKRDYKAARMDYNRLLEIDASSYSGRLGLVNLNQKEGKYKDAFDILTGMLNEYPNDATLYAARGGLEYEMALPELALADLDEAIRLQPDSPQSYVLRGEILLSEKKKSLAKKDFEKAISLGVPFSDLKEQLRMCK